MVAGQQKVIDGNTYFFAETGTMKSGWQQYPEGWYYATPDGAKIYGWRNINNEWYYLDENNIEYPGLMVNDPEKIIDGTTYYFNADGAMVRGWKQYPEGWYYQDPSGVRATGWRRVAGVWYYLDGNNTEYPGLLVTNCSKVSHIILTKQELCVKDGMQKMERGIIITNQVCRHPVGKM